MLEHKKSSSKYTPISSEKTESNDSKENNESNEHQSLMNIIKKINDLIDEIGARTENTPKSKSSNKTSKKQSTTTNEPPGVLAAQYEANGAIGKKSQKGNEGFKIEVILPPPPILLPSDIEKLNYAIDLSNKARIEAQSMKDNSMQAFVLFGQGRIFRMLHRVEEACKAFNESLIYARLIEDPNDKARAMYEISKGFREVQENEFVDQALVESLASAQEIENPILRAGSTHAIAEGFREINDLKNANRALYDCLISIQDIKDPAFYSHLTYRIGNDFREIGDHEKAALAFDKSFSAAQKIENSIFGLDLMELLHNAYQATENDTKANICIEKFAEIVKEREEFAEATHLKDIEAYTKAQYDSEMTDVALCSMRGCTVHGHSLRLEENGMQFDMLARTEMGKDGNIYNARDQAGIPLDRRINLGKPMTEAEAKKRTTIFRVDGIQMSGKVGSRKYDEAVDALHQMWEIRNKWGFRPG